MKAATRKKLLLLLLLLFRGRVIFKKNENLPEVYVNHVKEI